MCGGSTVLHPFLTIIMQLKSEYRREYDSLELAQLRLKTINHYCAK